MKILLLDIETAPNKGYFWRIYKENIGIDQILDSSYVMSWVAQWYGEREVMFDAFWKSGHKAMLKRMYKLLDEADVVVHYNGQDFDIPTLNKEFVKMGLTPPSPYKQVDLLRVVRQKFAFVSNKLNYITQTLGLGNKIHHRGFELWVKCMGEDRKYTLQEIRAARELMERYNRRDVILLRRLYKRLLPWIPNHPNWGAYKDGLRCPKCGGTHYHKRGTAVARSLRYQQYRCSNGTCRAHFRSNKPLNNGHRERFHEV